MAKGLDYATTCLYNAFKKIEPAGRGNGGKAVQISIQALQAVCPTPLLMSADPEAGGGEGSPPSSETARVH